MIRIAFAVTCLLLLAGFILLVSGSRGEQVAASAGAESHCGPKPSLEASKDAVRTVMSMVAKDPTSVLYRWPRDFSEGSYSQAGSVSNPAWELLVGVNAKNGFGGYVGARDYRFFFHRDAIVAIREPDAESDTVLVPTIPIAAAVRLGADGAALSK